MADAPSSTNNKRLDEHIVDLVQSVYSCLRTSVFTKTSYKAAIYWLIVVVGSFIHDFAPPPSSYLSYRKNVFNVYFVKIGWGWTWLLLSLLSIMTSSILTSGNILQVLRHYGRLLMATMAWFVWVTLFEYVEHFTGQCTGDSSHNAKHVCHRHGYFWMGFDISGHAFLLIHCSLTISEEIQVVKYLEKQIKESYSEKCSSSTGNLSFKSKYWYKMLWPFIYVTFLCTAALVVLWELMLVTTCIYFHTALQKILGASIAILTWWFTYRYWYLQEQSLLLPTFNKL